MDSGTEWWLWHASTNGERRRYKYPDRTRMASDGRGGVWLLCPTTMDGGTEWWLWHADQHGEHKEYQYPEGSVLVAEHA